MGKELFEQRPMTNAVYSDGSKANALLAEADTAAQVQGCSPSGKAG